MASCSQVPRVRFSRGCNLEVYSRFVRRNTPFILSGAPLLDPSPSLSDTDVLLNLLGGPRGVVPVADGDYSSPSRPRVTIDEFLASLSSAQPLYLKDCHLFLRHKASVSSERAPPSYRVPLCFVDDALNDYFDSRLQVSRDKDCVEQDDYRFLYAGGEGSWTSFHTDVLDSHSWSYNVRGCKVWLLFPPTLSAGRRDALSAAAEAIRSMVLSEPLATFESGVAPWLEGLRRGELAWLDLMSWSDGSPKEGNVAVVLQQPEEFLFVPSGWLHAVFNRPLAQLCVSLNCNWLSSGVLGRAAVLVLQETALARKNIADCRREGLVGCGEEGAVDVDWEWQCQRIVKASARLDIPDLSRLLYHRALRLLGPGLEGDGEDWFSWSDVDSGWGAGTAEFRHVLSLDMVAGVLDALESLSTDPFVAWHCAHDRESQLACTSVSALAPAPWTEESGWIGESREFVGCRIVSASAWWSDGLRAELKGRAVSVMVPPRAARETAPLGPTEGAECLGLPGTGD
jgi:hypothetical protein